MLGSGLVDIATGLFVPKPSTDAVCQRRSMAGLRQIVRVCPLASTVVGGDCHSLRHSVAREPGHERLLPYTLLSLRGLARRRSTGVRGLGYPPSVMRGERFLSKSPARRSKAAHGSLTDSAQPSESSTQRVARRSIAVQANPCRRFSSQMQQSYAGWTASAWEHEVGAS